jgi:tetratricopeptide (TPR) repeat protein
MRLSRLKEGDPIGLEPKLEVLCKSVLGEGGMGKVFLVQDPDLGRPAALKLMKPGRSERRAKRFRREAKVTARLDHPGIPPVYITGQTNSGHEYLLMRFVEGKSMAEVLADVRRSAPPDHPSRRELLHALVKIGEAMSYAHSKGIVHRDLKPANVMIGAFGEVLVMDWGLARDLEESELDDEHVRELNGETMPTGQAQLTQDGAVLGTPGYLAPEQAKGEDVDPRADVFAMGSMLVEVLTGQPAISGETVVQVVTKTGLGKIDLPASRDRRVAPELNAIASRALSVKRALRYPSMEDFTRDLRAYLEGQPVSVFRYGRVQQTLRLVRRHPTLFVGMALTFVLSLVGLWAVTRAKSEAAAAIQRQAAQEAEQAARAAWTDLADESVDVNKRIGAGLKALQAAHRWRTLSPEDDASGESLLQAASLLGELASAAEQWSLAEQAYLQARDLAPDRIDTLLAQVVEARDAEEATIRRAVEELFLRAEAGDMAKLDDLQEAVFAAVGHRHPVTLQIALQRLDAVSEKLARVQVAVYAHAEQPDRSEREAGERELTGLPRMVERYHEVGLQKRLSDADRELLEEADERLERRIARDPPGPGIRTAMDLIGRRQEEEVGKHQLQTARLACRVLGRLGIGQTEAAHALGRYLVVEGSGLRAIDAGLALCHIGTPEAQGVLLNAMTRFFSTHYRQQVEQAMERLPGDPPLEDESATSYVQRGIARWARGDVEGARRDFTEAILLDPKNGHAYNQRGNLNKELGQLDDARRDFDKAIEVQPERVGGWANRGSLRQTQRDFRGALRDMDRAFELSPLDGRILSNRALLKSDMGDLQGALDDLERAVELDPTFEIAWLNLGSVRERLGDAVGCLEAVNRAIELNPNFGIFYMLRAQGRAALGDYQGAMADFEKGDELDGPGLAVYVNRAGVRYHAGDLQGALVDLEQATKLAPEEGMAWNLMAEVYLEQGEAPQARSAALKGASSNQPLRGRVLVARSLARLGEPAQALKLIGEVLERRPKDDTALAARAEVNEREGELEAALVDLSRAIDFDDDYEPHFRQRARLHHRMGHLELAIADLERSIELKPRRLRTWVQRGDYKLEAGDVGGAAGDYSRALQLDRRDFPARLGRGRARLGQDQLDLALADLDEAVALRPEHGAAWGARGIANARLGKAAVARRDLEKAVDLDDELPDAWAYLALVRAGAKDEAGAGEAADRAVSLAGQRALPYRIRGQLRLAAGDSASALADLEQAFERDPDDPQVRLVRGRAHDAAGHAREAVADYEAYLASDPEGPDVERTRKRLEELR